MVQRGSRVVALVFFLTSALGAVGDWRHVPAILPPGKETQYPLYRRLDGPQGRSGRVRKISAPPGLDSQAVQSVAIRYTDWAVAAHSGRFSSPY